MSRNQLSWAEELLETFPAVVIQGARQVGKSTFARMLLESREHVSVTLDDTDTRESARLDPRAFVTQGGSKPLIIDEIQRDPGLLLAVKSAIDSDRRPGRFLLTGSSDLLRLSRTPDSLAGRATTLELHGFSQGEVAGRKEDFATWLRNSPDMRAGSSSAWTRSDYIAVLARGGFPEPQDLRHKSRAAWFDSYLQRLLKRDVGDVSRGLSSDRLAAVFRLVAANQGGELVQTRLADALTIPKSGIAAYLAALDILYLTSTLPPWRANLTRREIGRPKVSVTDSGLSMRLAKLSPLALAELNAAPLLGMQFEAFVASELTKQRGWSEEEYELFHFRDRNGLEVDIVVEFSDGMVFLIEVKASETYRAEHTRGIRALAERLGDRFIGGAVLGVGAEPHLLADRIWGLPISTLWEHK